MDLKEILSSAKLKLFGKANNISTSTETLYDNWHLNKVGTFQIPDILTQDNAFKLANTMSEIYYPIDFIADRISKLRFYIAKKSGKEDVNTELNRFITDINPFFSFNDLVYQYVFSLYGHGNSYCYTQVPTLYSDNVTVNNISRLDILNPDLLTIDEYTNISLLNVSSYNALIKRLYYEDKNIINRELKLNQFNIVTFDNTKNDSSLFLSKSPLFKAYRNINNLLAVYSARYNVYVNNGSAGYISRKSNPNSGIEEQVNPIDREMILKDINNRNGLTGKRNLWGISSVPIEYINTLSHIKDLLPLDETLENSIKIAGVYQIPSGLVPRKDQSTFDNQASQEKTVWENCLLSASENVCSSLTKVLKLNTVGYSIQCDYSNVPALNINKQLNESINQQQLINLKTIKELNPEADIIQSVNLILQGYGQEK